MPLVESECGRLLREAEARVKELEALLAEDRSTAPWDAWKAAEARVRVLEGALREWREAESSPDCIACCTLDAALADNVPRG
jgi:hypothetical protein